MSFSRQAASQGPSVAPRAGSAVLTNSRPGSKRGVNTSRNAPHGDRGEHPHSDNRTEIRLISVQSALRTLETRLRASQPPLNKAVVQIVKSFALVFLSRMATPGKEFLFDDRDWGRFNRSIDQTANNLSQFWNDQDEHFAYAKYWLDLMLLQGFEGPDARLKAKDQRFELKPLFTGWCRRRVSRAIAASDLRFLYSMQKGSKQSWPPLGAASELKAYQRHHERLGTARPAVDTTQFIELKSGKFTLRDQIVRESNRIFGRLTPEDLTKFLPSGSACQQASVRMGGCLSLTPQMPLPPVIESVTLRSVPVRVPFVQALPLDISNLIESFANTGESSRTLVLKPLGLPELASSFESWRSSSFFAALHKIEVDQESLDYSSGLGIFKFNRIRPIGIFEPGKIRMISVGDGVLNAALQPIQGAMTRAWKASGYSTMYASDLTERMNELFSDSAFAALSEFGRLFGIEPSEYLLVSGDYEAATDLLRKDATFAGIDGLKHLPTYDVLNHSFFAGVADYPTKIWPDAPQNYVFNEGQLMGHPASFPILCVINLACYKFAVQKWTDHLYKTYVKVARGDEYTAMMAQLNTARRFFLKHVIVNGDDILFRVPKCLIPYWKSAIAGVGFKLSEGKNYLSPDVAMINSQLFRKTAIGFVRLGYLNQTIVTGMNVKSSGDNKCTPTQIGREISTMCRHCPWAAAAIPLCFSRWPLFSLPRYKFVPNWYIPVALGGFGVDPAFAPANFKYTLPQRKIAANFFSSPQSALYRSEYSLDGPSTAELKMMRPYGKHFDRAYGRKAVEFQRRLVSLAVRPEIGPLLEDGRFERLSPPGWPVRFTMIGRAAGPRLLFEKDSVASVSLPFNPFLKPMSNRKIRHFNDEYELVSKDLAFCPPLLPFFGSHTFVETSKIKRATQRIESELLKLGGRKPRIIIAEPAIANLQMIEADWPDHL